MAAGVRPDSGNEPGTKASKAKETNPNEHLFSVPLRWLVMAAWEGVLGSRPPSLARHLVAGPGGEANGRHETSLETEARRPSGLAMGAPARLPRSGWLR